MSEGARIAAPVLIAFIRDAMVAVGLPALVTSDVNAAVNGSGLDPVKVAASLGYLEQAYGVNQAEALRRLELQVDATQLDSTLRAKASDSYGGMAIDQQHGTDAGRNLRIVNSKQRTGARRFQDHFVPSAPHVRETR